MDINEEIKKIEEGQWFTLDGTKANFKIKVLKPKELKQITKSCSEKKFVNGRITEVVNHKALEKILLDKCVVAWENITDGENDLECNLENKIRLNDSLSQFAHLWNSVVSESTVGYHEREDELEKN